MEKALTLEQIKEKAKKWLSDDYDAETRARVQHLIENDEKELVDSFYKDLEFGTGGLRGIMGIGTNRMNIYTVGVATQGLCNYLKNNFKHLAVIKVAIAYDSRNNGPLFARTTAGIFAANGIKAYLFDELRPTPELSFAIRHLGCQSGVVLTASHNPKEYNGYKAYWEDGGQVIAPHDQNIVNEARKISSIKEVKFIGNEHLIEIIGKETDEAYLDEIVRLSLSPEVIKRQNDFKIVYTAIHGTGTRLVPEVLRRFGFTNILTVPEQMIPDGNFPTVKSPNPENAEALSRAVALAEKEGAELVMATDPDADRVGIAVKSPSGAIRLLNGNQAASLLIYYLLKKWEENGKLKGKEYLVKTIVTTDLIADMAAAHSVECFDVLTGFKYIADLIRQNEGTKKFIGGGEESYGYLAGEFVRDKDAVMSCALIAEAAAWAKDQGKTLFDILTEIYSRFGFYLESLLNVEKKGKSGEEEIAAMMENYRKTPPAAINTSPVVRICDYQSQEDKNLQTGTISAIKLPKSNVLQFFTADGSKISVRPSGTEPKIKFYFAVKKVLTNAAEYEKTEKELSERIHRIISDLKL